jgi:hypothetical protein
MTNEGFADGEEGGHTGAGYKIDAGAEFLSSFGLTIGAEALFGLYNI